MVFIQLPLNLMTLGCSQRGKVASVVSLRNLEGGCQIGNGANKISLDLQNQNIKTVLETESKPSTFPNPFTTELNIKFTASGNEDAFFEVFDLQGKKMYNSTAQKQEVGSFVQETLDTANWAAGMYIIKTYGGNGESSTQKIIKQ